MARGWVLVLFLSLFLVQGIEVQGIEAQGVEATVRVAAIESVFPTADTTVNEDQVFMLRFGGKADQDSVLANAYFTADGIGERIGVKIITGADRKRILKDHSWRLDGLKPSAHLLVQAVRNFPSSSKIALILPKGIKTEGRPSVAEQTFAFNVRAPFTAEFRCTRVNANADCLPLDRLTVQFSNEVPVAMVRKAFVSDASGKEIRSVKFRDTDDAVRSLEFAGPFSERSVLTIHLPDDLRDEADRELANADKFPLTVKTDTYPPLAKFAGTFGILEWKANPVLPITVRKLEAGVSARVLDIGGKRARIAADPKAIIQWYNRVEVASNDYAARDKSVLGPESKLVTSDFTLPRQNGTDAFEVIGLPFKNPGLYVVELQSKNLGAALLGRDVPMFVPTMALVTDLGVHFKWGGESSLVWVTKLSDGKPADGAAVRVADCEGKLLWSGKTDSNGIARIANLPAKDATTRCKGPGGMNSGLLVLAELAADAAFVHSDWQQGIEPWRFQVSTDYWKKKDIVRTVFDRSLLRAGEALHLKHILRHYTTLGFSGAVAKNRVPNKLTITHVGSDQKYELPVKFDAKGVAESTWNIPKEAKLGSYTAVLSRDSDKKKKEYVHNPFEEDAQSFRVEEFRVPLMRATIQGPKTSVVAASSFPIDIAVGYLSGGGAGKQKVKVRALVQSQAATMFPAFENFVFSNGPVKEGLERGNLPASEDDETDEDAEILESNGKRSDLVTRDAVLDAAGTAKVVIDHLPKDASSYTVLTELQFDDPNGEVQTVSTNIPVFPADRLVAIKSDKRVVNKSTLKFAIAVAALNGKGVPDAAVKVELFQRKVYSHRKRMVGGFYAYEHTTETKRLQTFCQDKTDARGLLTCDGSADAAGEIVAQATVVDNAGRTSVANTEVWLADDNTEWWFDTADNDRMDILPESKRYEPGATAKIQVRMPFRTATALIAVEREGIIDTYVRTVSGKDPIVEIPIKPNYAPNVFVSVLAVRGRVEEYKPTATVDLGRPAFKLGITELKVGWAAHELKVAVQSDKPVYQTRESAAIDVTVTDSTGKPVMDGEIALAAVDEGLLELMGNKSWDLLPAMMGQRSYDVENATAAMYIVGKRHFGLKALPAGGSGGRGATRELFDTLLLWKGRVTLDNKGRAQIKVPLNDSITGFRIVAVAQAGMNQFGTGATTIRTTQDLMLFSGLPPVVRESDQFDAHFTVRNTTRQILRGMVQCTVEGGSDALPPIHLELAAGEGKEITWPIKIPIGITKLQYTVEARVGGRTDRLKVAQKVQPAVPVRTYNATLSQLAPNFAMPVERAKDALPGRGGLQVTLQNSLVASLDGVREYMRDYSYTCLEQQISRAIATNDASAWYRIDHDLPSFVDKNGLLKFFPTMDEGSDVLTAYVLAIAHQAGFELSSPAVGQMRQALERFVTGKLTVASSPTRNLIERKIAAFEAISRYQGPQEDLLNAIDPTPEAWPTSTVIQWAWIQKRLSPGPERDARLTAALTVLRNRMTLQGTVLSFSAEPADQLWWLMTSTDENAVKTALLVHDLPEWKNEMPQLMRGAIGRQKRGHWDLTTANAWGVLAVGAFAKAFEGEAVSGTATVTLAGKNQRLAGVGGNTLLPWPEAGPATLELAHTGTGKPWAMVRSTAAIPRAAPLSVGFKVTKTVAPIEQKTPGRWSRGDLARVTLNLQADADMGWVVVEDPIPAGSIILGSGLGRDSKLATSGEVRTGDAWPAFEQRSFDGYRGYYEFVNKGEWKTEYTIRLNNTGHFQMPPTRVEAMYAPEVFAEAPNLQWDVVD